MTDFFCFVLVSKAAAGELRELEDILCDHHFIQAKCRLGMAAKLLEDFSPQGRRSSVKCKLIWRGGNEGN